jgi:hypothetical protein
MTSTLADLAPTNCWFGRSQSATDPYFKGQMSSVRVYGRALEAAEIVAPQPSITAPASGTHFPPGSLLQFAGSATDFADVPLAASTLSWTVEFHDAGVTNVVFGPLNGVAGGSYPFPADGPEATNGFHRILLSATDTQGRSATNWLDVFPGPAGADWASFYPFDAGAADANGFFDGVLLGGSTTGADVIRGSILNLGGTGQYVGLPAGVGGMRTFAGWVKWNGGGNWQRIFDFGVDTSRYAFLTPSASTGKLRFAITPAGSLEERIVEATQALPLNTWTHVAVTLDGRQAVLFVNGQAVAVNSSVNLLPSDIAGSANYFGRSQFAGPPYNDPYFNGQMDSVQIASQCLPIEQITASTLAISNSLAGVTLSWPAWNSGLVLHSATDLGAGVWTTVTNPPAATNGINFLSLPAGSDAAFFRLQLP